MFCSVTADPRLQQLWRQSAPTPERQRPLWPSSTLSQHQRRAASYGPPPPIPALSTISFWIYTFKNNSYQCLAIDVQENSTLATLLQKVTNMRTSVTPIPTYFVAHDGTNLDLSMDARSVLHRHGHHLALCHSLPSMLEVIGLKRLARLRKQQPVVSTITKKTIYTNL